MTVALRFGAPPPGLAPHTAFELDPVEGSAALFAMWSVDDPAVRLFLVDPRDVVPDYAPVLSDAQAGRLGLTSAGDAQLLLVAQMTDEGVGVNLLAPVVLNRRTGDAAQVILEGQDLPVRAILN
ncbi:flagellar assembly protein FliW [Microbacterium sp. zg.Y1090]|uniref:flagellar assembly protein FliW n=1 Tax=Microbacterium TaxID=33882 RepID=UPI00214BD909|nr:MULTISPECIES: flagellar assembly protein FliW [unclassified Microbacterium]MCR2813967.1 flagellar assembly protein FliW [Microbacterium sp. zg.Y1084]MCR2819241.1 flagellar assembly protein FliW [Microbacterium sp. zg.Y1090]MDL5487158.1 flagellar assembly protein FliW [Microbacterium sp. zg-Y1211]WIM28223.1 flagellar assembly protein FliW [Microbacterium sp. zg-Y1090]